MNGVKNKVLFLIGNLESGGVSKSMVNLLQAFDKERYEVALWMGSPTGLYRDMVPENVRLIWNERNVWVLQGLRGLIPLLLHGHLFCFIVNFLRIFTAIFSRAWAGWLLSRLLKPLEEEFDAIIDYNGQHQLYFMVDKLKAKKKITFFHNDYSKWPYYRSMDARYFPRVDAICSISDYCVKVLKELFPDCSHKMHMMENISSPASIEQLAKEDAPELAEHIERDIPYIVTVGHITERKGTDLAIQAIAILKNSGLNVKWFFVGNNVEEGKFLSLAKNYGVSDNILILGMRPNPYPYMKKADMIVHPARYEGKSIALDESKLLCKPIVVTNFSTVHDQFEHGVNATICEMNPESLANAIQDLWMHPKKREQYSSWLKEHLKDNSREVEKLYQMIES